MFGRFAEQDPVFSIVLGQSREIFPTFRKKSMFSSMTFTKRVSILDLLPHFIFFYSFDNYLLIVNDIFELL